MTRLYDVITLWPSLPFAIITLRSIPGAAFRLLIRTYPLNDPRRRELLADFDSFGQAERVTLIVGLVETVMREAVPYRLKNSRRQLRRITAVAVLVATIIIASNSTAWDSNHFQISPYALGDSDSAGPA